MKNASTMVREESSRVSIGERSVLRDLAINGMALTPSRALRLGVLTGDDVETLVEQLESMATASGILPTRG